MKNSMLTIQHWAPERRLPLSRQFRTNDPIVDRMAASITEYGFKIPILVSSEGEIIDGDLRLKAARQLGLAEGPTRTYAKKESPRNSSGTSLRLRPENSYRKSFARQRHIIRRQPGYKTT